MTKKTDGKKPDLKLVSGKSEITKLVKSRTTINPETT